MKNIELVLKTISLSQDIEMLSFLEQTKVNEEYRQRLHDKVLDELKKINEDEGDK